MKDHVQARTFLKRPSFRGPEENIIFPCIFLKKIIFHFLPKIKIIFSRKRNMVFPNNTRKIMFKRDFFGKTNFSGRLEKENMVFRAVQARNQKNFWIFKYIFCAKMMLCSAYQYRCLIQHNFAFFNFAMPNYTMK